MIVDVLIIALSLMLALMLLPFRISADGTADDRQGIEYNLVVSWAYGLIAVKLRTFRQPAIYLLGIRLGHIPIPSGRKKKKRPKKPKRKKKSATAWISWGKVHVHQLSAVIGRFIRATALQGSLVMHVGLSDPADTAHVGLLWNMIRNPARRIHTNLVCVYHYEIIRIAAQLQATLIIGYLVLVAIGLMLKKQNRLMLRSISQN